MRKNAIILSFISLLFLFASTCQASELRIISYDDIKVRSGDEVLPLFYSKADLQILLQPLPVLEPDYPERDGDIRNPFSFEQMRNFTGGTEKGLLIDLRDTSFQGTIYTGPYPFESGEADYDYARYRRYEPLEDGAGLLRIDKFFSDKYNANDWPVDEPSMTIGYRLDIDGYGFFDSVVSFKGDPDSGFMKKLTIAEGPFVTMLTSDHPRSVVIAFETDEPCRGMVEVKGLGVFPGADDETRHEIEVSGLQPSRNYKYRVVCEGSGDETFSPYYKFRAAPFKRGVRPVSFAFASDSREGVGGGERNYMGHNFNSMSRLANSAYRKGADLFIFGGDLVNGYTSEKDDFRLQLKGWKQSLAGFWRSRPVYPAMGNHETLVNVYDDDSKYGISLDKWPYATDSAEAVFAQEFYNPENGPMASDSRRPAYKENVYKFQYGSVLFIAFNNNYWWTSNKECKNYGGSPEGYVMEDQLEWIAKVLKQAERDRKVRYIVLYAQEPVFPCGGHPNDAMWYYGDNRVKAWEYNGTDVVPAGKGMIEVRNRFWESIAKSSKVAAVLTGDEHAYHRTLIDRNSPVGIMSDDLNDDGVINWHGLDVDGDGVPEPQEQTSQNQRFKHPVWHITAGTGGAPYYARQDVPWTDDVRFFSSQTGYCMFKANKRKISMTFYTITGQKLDHIDDLMAVKEINYADTLMPVPVK